MNIILYIFTLSVGISIGYVIVASLRYCLFVYSQRNRVLAIKELFGLHYQRKDVTKQPQDPTRLT